MTGKKKKLNKEILQNVEGGRMRGRQVALQEYLESGLPSWIPKEAWTEYLLMRKRLKKPLETVYAMKLAITKLEELKKQGYTPEAVLNQSILNSWQGLFPVKQGDFRGRKSGMDKTIDVLENFVKQEELKNGKDPALPSNIR